MSPPAKTTTPDVGLRLRRAVDQARSTATTVARRIWARLGPALAGVWTRTLDTLKTFSGRTRSGTAQFAAAVGQHRHGTWLVLFFALFTGLWLLTGWAGIANGIGRGLLVGIATPFAVNALYPLRRAR